jgi:hypothetical protein
VFFVVLRTLFVVTLLSGVLRIVAVLGILLLVPLVRPVRLIPLLLIAGLPLLAVILLLGFVLGRRHCAPPWVWTPVPCKVIRKKG